MQAASILLALITILISALLLLFTVKGHARHRIHLGIRGNAPWLALLLFCHGIGYCNRFASAKPSLSGE